MEIISSNLPLEISDFWYIYLPTIVEILFEHVKFYEI